MSRHQKTLWDLHLEFLANGTTSRNEVRRYQNVIVANGHLWDPKYSDFPGEFFRTQIHSHYYRVPDPYEGKTVLVVGIGNSAVDIAVDVARHAADFQPRVLSEHPGYQPSLRSRARITIYRRGKFNTC